MTPISYRRYSFPSAIIQHAVGRAFAANLRRTRPRPDTGVVLYGRRPDCKGFDGR